MLCGKLSVIIDFFCCGCVYKFLKLAFRTMNACNSFGKLITENSNLWMFWFSFTKTEFH